MSRPNLPVPLRYGVAVLAVAVATAFTRALPPLAATPLAMFFVAVLVSAWLGRLIPALLAIVLSGFAVAWLLPESPLVEPPFTWADGLRLGVFIQVTLLIVYVTISQQQAEEAERAQRERLRATLASIGDAVIVTDAAGRIVSLNAVAESLTGWSLRDARGRPLDEVFRVVSEDTRAPVDSPAARVLRAGHVVGPGSHNLLLARDGTERLIDDSAAPIRRSDGQIAGVVLVFRDMTERHRGEDERTRLAAIVESSEDAIFAKTLDGIVTSWNAAAERMYGYLATEAVGRHVSFLFPNGHLEELPSILDRLKRGEGTNPYETVRRRKDGRLVGVSVNISPVRDRVGRVVGASVIARDVSERRAAERRRNVQVAVTRILAEAATPEAAAPQILEAVCRQLGWSVGGFWAADGDRDVLRCLAAWHAPDVRAESFVAASLARVVARGEGLPGRVWATSAAAWIANVALDPNFPRAAAVRTSGLRGAFACPVRVGIGECLGVLEFFSRDWCDQDAPLLEVMTDLASQFGQFLERKRAEDALRAREEHLRLALEAGGMGTWEWDIATNRVAWSPTVKTLHGLAPDTFPSTFDDILADVHPDDRDRFRATVARTLEEGQHRIEYRLLRSGGEVRWVEGRGKVFRDEAGRPRRVVGVFLDITERLRARAILEEAELRFRQLAENVTDVFWISDPVSGRIVYISPAYEDIWGRSCAALHANYESFLDVIHEEDRDRVRAAVGRQASGEATAEEYRIVRPDGAIRWVWDRGFPIRDAAGRVYRVAGIAEDITGRKAAEQQIRESEQRFRVMADSAPVLLWVADTSGACTFFNRPWLEFTGRAADQEVGDGWVEGVHPDDRKACLGARRAALHDRRPFRAEYRLRHADGAHRWILDTSVPRFTPDGTFAGLTGSCVDITDRKKAEDALRFLSEASGALASSLDYETTLASVARLAVPRLADWCAVDMVGPDGSIRRLAVAHVDPTRVDLAHELVRRYPPDAASPRGVPAIVRTGRPELIPEISDRMLAEATHDAELLRILRGLGLRSYIGVPLLAENRILGAITLMAAESGRRFDADDLAVAEELARRAASAIENARLYREVREADRRKDEFLATLAHELRNPLAPIRNALHILKEGGANPTETADVREMMERQVQHLVRLVDDLLDVSRVMRGKVELRKEPLDLGTAVARAVETARPLLDARGHRLEVSLPPEPVQLEADPVRVAQVVANLLNNAAKYTEKPGLIRLTAERDGGDVVLRVRDTGIGIAPELLLKVFDLFTQADHSLGRSQGGLGIGLTLVRSLVELHGGTVEARSEGLGKGSEFIVRLPATPAGHPHRGEPAATSEGTVGARDPQRRVLIVDDNVDAAESLAVLARIWGHDVRVAHDGEQGLKEARAYRPEVVLLDIGMPGLSGYDVARRLRAIPALNGVLVVAMTGWGQPQDRERSKEAGFDLHLTKPADPELLHFLLARLHLPEGTTADDLAG